MNESHKVMLGRFFDERVSVLLRASLDDYCSESYLWKTLSLTIQTTIDQCLRWSRLYFAIISLNEIKEDNNIETSSQVPRNEVMTVILRTIVDTHIRCISGIDNLLLYG